MKTDRTIQEDVLEEIGFDPRTDAKDVAVAVDAGIVTLRVTVKSLYEKWATEDATRRVGGVRGVVPQLSVEPPSMHQRDDKDIARAALDALAAHSFVPAGITVTVQNGCARLDGKVSWQYQRQEAEDVVRRITGIRQLSNGIELTVTVPPADVKAKIERSFKRDAEIDARNITVATTGRKVTLSGTAHSWFERDEASQAAWSVPGVMEVENRVLVTA